MDSEGFSNNEAQENRNGSQGYLWIAAVIVGVILLLMVSTILVIVLRKCIKKSGNPDPNWAGPSPYATGDFPEIMTVNMMQSITPTACLSVTEFNSITGIQDIPEHECKIVAQSDTNVNANILFPPAFGKEDSQPPNVINEIASTDELFLPPPPDSFLECFISNEEHCNKAIGESHPQPPPLSKSEYQADNNTLRPSNEQHKPNCEMAMTYNIDDQQLPPPPPEFLAVT